MRLYLSNVCRKQEVNWKPWEKKGKGLKLIESAVLH